MGKKPNAANITHALAQLGGGSKKDGGDGMKGGLEFIFNAGKQAMVNELKGISDNPVKELMDSSEYVDN